MKIVCLMENTPAFDGIIAEHGFSLYIEAAGHKILVDSGSSSAFIDNAEKLKVDLKKVDMVMLSHGHYDHAGGLLEFSNINDKAPIYMQKGAGKDYYHNNATMEKYIGIDKDLLRIPQVKLIGGNMEVGDNISIFTGVKGRRHFPSGNLELMVRVNSGGDVSQMEFVQDDFSHEQYVVIWDEGKKILISGCAHNGILNILDEYRKLYGDNPDIVISGFHLMKKNGYTEEDVENIKAIARELKGMDTIFYTGHCTGLEPFHIMKEIMGEKLRYIHSGDSIYQESL